MHFAGSVECMNAFVHLPSNLFAVILPFFNAFSGPAQILGLLEQNIGGSSVTKACKHHITTKKEACFHGVGLICD